MLAGAGAALLGVGAFVEWRSLRGAFDHRSAPAASAKERYLASLAALDASPSIVHVAHSTHLLALGGLRILTDPWFFDPAFGALTHAPAPAVRPDDLGPLDVVLVSHDHADHADLRAMDRMDKRAAALVATADLAARVRSLGFSEVDVLAPWETWRRGEVVVTAVPGLHDIYEIGFVAGAAGTSVYFAGDSRLHPDLPAIAERFAPAVSILPVDGTRLAGGAMHVMTPDDAVTAARTLGSRIVMPSHAEAVFSDPLAKYVLASTIEGAREKFRTAVLRDLPGVRCEVPEAGALVRLAGR
jgi:L-ascorbate metabolism protein UlaG (beta-lactamase superfamily)